MKMNMHALQLPLYSCVQGIDTSYTTLSSPDYSFTANYEYHYLTNTTHSKSQKVALPVENGRRIATAPVAWLESRHPATSSGLQKTLE